MEASRAHLGFRGSSIIVTVWRSTEGSARARVAGANASPLGQVLLALGLADLNLRFLATAAEFLGLEGALGLELRSAMVGDVAVSHGCG